MAGIERNPAEVSRNLWHVIEVGAGNRTSEAGGNRPVGFAVALKRGRFSKPASMERFPPWGGAPRELVSYRLEAKKLAGRVIGEAETCGGEPESLIRLHSQILGNEVVHFSGPFRAQVVAGGGLKLIELPAAVHA